MTFLLWALSDSRAFSVVSFETDADLLYIYMFHIYIYLHNASILRHFGSSLLELTKVVLRLKSFLPSSLYRTGLKLESIGR